jgi:general L-amino acid transport system permease protein
VFITGRWQIVDDNLALFLHKVWPAEQLWRLSLTLLVLSAGFGLLVGATSAGAEADDEPTPDLGAKARSIVGRLWPVMATAVLLLVLAGTTGPILLVLGLVAAYIAGRLLGRFAAGDPTQIGDRRRTVTALSAAFILLAGLAMIILLTAARPLDDWGGVMLNIYLALFSITLCFPLGVVLALGRRSDLPVVRWLCTGFIEAFRGVPLFVLLLMANNALGFFVPQSVAPGTVVRAIVVFILFSAAYVAEIVRGGLQSLPKGQVEAGKALGLSSLAITRRIVLPQALRNVIPALVGQFISLFKDTTLAGAAMGLTGLLVAAEASTAQSAFRGQRLLPEALAFVMLLFWVGSYTMSNESQRLERRLGVGNR